MYRISYLLFTLTFIIQQSLAVSLYNIEDVHQHKLIEFTREDVKKITHNIPSTSIVKLHTFLKESKTRITQILPLLTLAGIEMYLETSYDQMGEVSNYKSKIVKNSDQKIGYNWILSVLPLFLAKDILFSSSFISINANLYKYIVNPLLTVSDLTLNTISHMFIYLLAAELSNTYPKLNFLSLYTVLSFCVSTNKMLQARFRPSEKINEYQNNLNKCIQRVPTADHLDKCSNIFLYTGNNDKYCHGSIEDFYAWIIDHKNDVCLYNLIDCAYVPYNIKTNYPTTKLAYRYQPGNIDNPTIYCTKSRLTFKLIEQNKKITQSLLTRTLQKPGIKLIEVDGIQDADGKTIDKCIGIINDGENYYLAFGIYVDDEIITNRPQTYRQIIWNKIFNDNYPKTSTLVIKIDTSNKIQSIMEILFLYLDFNYHTCVYDVVPYSNYESQ